MTERDRIRFGDTTIDYEVRRSERRKKTVQITVDGAGVWVAAPMPTPAVELRPSCVNAHLGSSATRRGYRWRRRRNASSAAKHYRTWAAMSA